MGILDSDQQIKQTGSIYIIRNTINDKVYIGQTTTTVRERFLSHLKPSIHKTRGTYKLYNAMIKYGKENFYYEVLEENVPVKELDEKEINYIKEYDSFNNGYNSTPGGNVRRIHEEYDIQNIVDLFGQGYNSKEIGEMYNVCSATIMRTLHGSGHQVHDQIDDELLRLLFDCGFNNKQIAHLINSKEWTIQRYLRKIDLHRKRQKYYYRTDINYKQVALDYNFGLFIDEICKKHDIDKKTIEPIVISYYNEQLEKCNDYERCLSTLEDELLMEAQSNSDESINDFANRVKEIVCANRNIGINVYVLLFWYTLRKR